MKKLLSIILVFCFLFIFSFYSFAADGTSNIDVSNMNFKAEVTIDTTPDNTTDGVITENVNVTTGIMTGNSDWNGYYYFRFPSPTDVVNERRLFANIWLDDNLSIISGHEYNLSFTWGYNVALTAFCTGVLRFYNNDGEIIKEQNLFVSNSDINEKKSVVDINFIPDTTGLTSGYKCELEMWFLQYGYNSLSGTQYFFISPEITLIDKDDDSGWFQKIINKINDVWESIKSLPDNIGNKINELKENITLVITNLKDNLLEGIKSLFIPRENYFNDKLTELQTFFDEKFGVFALPFTLIIQLLQLYNNVGTGSGILHLNEFKIDNNVLFSARDINLKQLITDFSQELYQNSGIDLYDIYLAFIDVIILFAFVRLIKMKYDKMISSGAFDMPKDIMNERGSATNVDGGGYKN